MPGWNKANTGSESLAQVRMSVALISTSDPLYHQSHVKKANAVLWHIRRGIQETGKPLMLFY